MIMCLKVLLLAAVVTISAQVFSQDKSEQFTAGTIEGSISFTGGEIAANIQLLVLAPEKNYRRFTRADDQGHYKVDNLPLGNVVLYPYNSSDLYPLRGNMFLSKNPDRIELTKEHPNATKNIIVPPKAGIIEGTVLSNAGLRIPDAQVVLCHSAEPGRSAEIHSDDTGHFRYIVPSGEGISVYTRSGGNRPSQQANIILQPGEKRNMQFVTTTGSGTATAGAHFEGEPCRPFRPTN
jgi:hypothetical protein